MFVSIYFIGGLMLANMGVLGLYLGKVFNEVKERPLYIVKDSINIEPAEAPGASAATAASDRGDLQATAGASRR